MPSRDGSDLAWVAWLAVGTAMQARALARRTSDQAAAPGPFCHLVRRTFHTDTAPGRAVFTAAWLTAGAWFGHHILAGPR